MVITIADIELTADCRKCSGYGYLYPWTAKSASHERVECDRCGATGEVLSENGEQLIQFLKRFWNEVE